MVVSVDEELAQLICPNCHVGMMCEHPESHQWLKCEVCGFCKLKPLKVFGYTKE